MLQPHKFCHRFGYFHDNTIFIFAHSDTPTFLYQLPFSLSTYWFIKCINSISFCVVNPHIMLSIFNWAISMCFMQVFPVEASTEVIKVRLGPDVEVLAGATSAKVVFETEPLNIGDKAFLKFEFLGCKSGMFFKYVYALLSVYFPNIIPFSFFFIANVCHFV